MTNNQLSLSESNQSISTAEEIIKLDENEKRPIDNNHKLQTDVETLEEIEPITKHTLVTSPWSRLGMIGIPLGGGFLIFFLLINSLFNGGNKSDIKIAKPDKSNQQTQQALSDKNDGDVYAQLALSKQAEELDKIDSQKKSQPPKVEKTAQQPAKTFSEVPVQRQPVTVASTPMAPRSVRSNYSTQQSRPIPAVTQQRNYSNTTDRPQSVTSSTSSVEVTDPTLELNRLRSLGSFGEIAYTTISEDNISSSDNQTIPTSAEDNNSSTPTQTPIMVSRQRQLQNPTMPIDERLEPNQNTEVPNNNIEKISPRWLTSKSDKPTLVASSYLPQENQILSEYPTSYLMVGEYASGVMVTPAIKQETRDRNPQQSSDNKRFVAKTTEDLHDNYGNIAIPANTLFAIELVSVDGGSYATVEVTSIIKDNTEYPISRGAISVLGAKGKPLIAKKFQDKGGEIAQYDITLGLVSGLGKVGEVLNESDSTTIINSSNNSYSSSSSSSSRRDIGGAFLEGAFGKLTNIIGKRTETANNEIAARPNVWYIAKDTPVTFMVNRTMELP